MGIRVIFPGAFTTVQDEGRYGYQALGVPVSGPMDREAYETANTLAGNDPSAAELEMTLLGGIFHFDTPALAALAGADMSPKLNGAPVDAYKPLQISAGDTLSLGYAASGCRTYLAVHGGFDVPLVMGSRSTTTRCQLGGLEGRPLKAGDILEILKPESPAIEASLNQAGTTVSGTVSVSSVNVDVEKVARPTAVSSASVDALAGGSTAEATASGSAANSPAGADAAATLPAPPHYTSSVTVRAMPGPQDDMFTEKGLETFFSQEYVMEEGSDRMGIRLKGAPVEAKGKTDILSDGIVFGSVQITSSGQPIVLMADHQTTGGYAKIATVLSDDLWKLAQMKPGDTVRFERLEQ